MGGGSAAFSGVRDEARRLLPQALQAIERRLRAYLKRQPRHRVHRLLAEIALDDRWPPSVRQRALELIRNEALRAAVEHLRTGKPLEQCVSVRRILSRLEKHVYKPFVERYGQLIERYKPVVAGLVVPERVGVWVEEDERRIYITYWFKWSWDQFWELVERRIFLPNPEFYADYEPLTVVVDKASGRLEEVVFRVHYVLVRVPAEELQLENGRIVVYFAATGHTPVPKVKPEGLNRIYRMLDENAPSRTLADAAKTWVLLTSIIGGLTEALRREVDVDLLYGPPRRYRLRHRPLSTPWR